MFSNTVGIRILCYVVVQFYPWFKFHFLSFLGIVIYGNDFETKEYKISTKLRIKLNHNIYIL